MNAQHPLFLYELWLANIPGMTPQRAAELKAVFGNAKQVYEGRYEQLMQHPDGAACYHKAMDDKSLERAKGIATACEALDIEIIVGGDGVYPRRLEEIPDAPPLLYVKGTLPPVDEVFGVGVVGSRRPTLYGKNMAQQIAQDLAQAGAVVISGMARGIDSAAHRGALRGGGKTIAVLGCGVDVVYPPENRELKQLIEQEGAVVSEYPPGTPPLGVNFPQRNRIISGLGLALVLVQGKATSGSMITGRLALEHGRDVFCVPGNVDEPLSSAPNQLIRDGAILLTNAAEILISQSWQFPELILAGLKKKTENSPFAGRPADQIEVLQVLHKNKPTHVDDICFQTHLDASGAAKVLLVLELEGIIAQLPGKQYIMR